MQTKIISVVAKKGGVGKTTTAQHIARGLCDAGYKVLMFDGDPQGTLTLFTAADRQTPGMYEIMTGKIDDLEAIQHTEQGDIVTNNENMDAIAGKIPTTAYKEILSDYAGMYDYIIIDTPPGLGKLTTNALRASDYVILPAEPTIDSADSITKYATVIIPEAIKQNNNLQVLGVLISKVKHYKSVRESAESLRSICGSLGLPVFNAMIRDASAINNAHNEQKTVYDLPKKDREKIAADYDQLITEIIERTK